MPKYSREMEEKIIELIGQGYKNSQISRELGIYRGAVSKRRKAHEKQKQNQEKPEPEQEETVQQEQTDSHPLDPQIYTLIRYQGTNSREEALSQAIDTQHSFNPYILNLGLNSPKELIKFFEEELKLERALAKDLMSDLKTDSDISRGLIADYKKTIAELKELAEKNYEEGIEQGRHDNAIYVQCAHCGEPYQVEPQSEPHGVITQALVELGWGHASCVRKDEYNRGAGSRALEAALRY